MVIERTNTEIIFRLPPDIDTSGLQRILNYLKFKEAVKDSQALDDEANDLANESKKRWWEENRHRFIK